MDLLVLLKPIFDMISAGNYVAAVLCLSILGFIILWRKLHKIQKDQAKPKTNYNKFIVKDSLIMDELELIRTQHRADRAVVIELQNGSYNLGKIATLKAFVRNEKIKNGVFSSKDSWNGTPASFLSSILRVVVNDEVFSLSDYESLKERDFSLYQNLVSINTKSLYAFPLISREGILYGAIMIHYCVDKKALSEKELSVIKTDVERINGEILMMRSTSD